MEKIQEKNSVGEGKNIAIISYLTVVGLVVAFFLNKEKNSTFAKFHIRQNLGLLTIGLATGIMKFIPFAGSIISMIVGAVLFFLWIIGLFAAINREAKEVPFVGNLFQKWFSTL